LAAEKGFAGKVRGAGNAGLSSDAGWN
jgi:hypothetical protein